MKRTTFRGVCEAVFLCYSGLTLLTTTTTEIIPLSCDFICATCFSRYLYVRLDGSMSIKKRAKVVDKFNDVSVSSYFNLAVFLSNIGDIFVFRCCDQNASKLLIYIMEMADCLQFCPNSTIYKRQITTIHLPENQAENIPIIRRKQILC